MDVKRKGLLEIHIAVFLFGLAGIFGKLILLPALIIVLGRVFFAAFFLLILMLNRKESLKLKRKKDYGVLLLLGAILAIHWVTFFQAVKISTVAIGLLTFSTFPIFVTFLEPYFFKEKLYKKDIFVALITFAGVLLVVPTFEIGNKMVQGAIWGVLSGFTFAVLSILNRQYVKQYSSITISFYQDSAAMLVLLPFLFILHPVFSLKDIALIIVLGVVFTGISHTLFIQGLSAVKAQTASIIASLEPVYGIILAIVILNEIPGFKAMLGGLLILGMALYSTLMHSSEAAMAAEKEC